MSEIPLPLRVKKNGYEGTRLCLAVRVPFLVVLKEIQTNRTTTQYFGDPYVKAHPYDLGTRENPRRLQLSGLNDSAVKRIRQRSLAHVQAGEERKPWEAHGWRGGVWGGEGGGVGKLQHININATLYLYQSKQTVL